MARLCRNARLLGEADDPARCPAAMGRTVGAEEEYEEEEDLAG